MRISDISLERTCKAISNINRESTHKMISQVGNEENFKYLLYYPNYYPGNECEIQKFYIGPPFTVAVNKIL